jgi:hypothetical protein
MKEIDKKWFLISVLLLFMLSCGTWKQILPQKGFLQFINPEGDYPDGIEVYIDKLPIGIAMVTADTTKGTTRDRMAVPSGRVLLKAVYEGIVMINDSITVAPNIITHIELPKHQY